MFGFSFLTTAVALLSVASTVANAGLVDRQQVYSRSLRVNTWVWTGMHRISAGKKPTDDEIYSLAIVALDDAFEDYQAAKKAGVDMGNAYEPAVLTATLTGDRHLYFSTPLQSVDRRLPFVEVAQRSPDPGAAVVTSLLRRCSQKPPPDSVARLHEHHAACGEISTLYMYSRDHPDPKTISGSTDITIGYNNGRYPIKPPCRKTHEAATYGCKDVTTAAHFTDIETATRISTREFREQRMTKLTNPALQPIIDAVPRTGPGCSRPGNARRDGGDYPVCNGTMVEFTA